MNTVMTSVHIEYISRVGGKEKDNLKNQIIKEQMIVCVRHNKWYMKKKKKTVPHNKEKLRVLCDQMER